VTALVATDLDRTLIFSPAATARLGGALPALPVEVLDGVVISELADVVASGLRTLAAEAVLVPTTTRTVAQLARVSLPAVRFAIAANGGVVLVDGVPDADWAGRITETLDGAMPLSEAVALLTAACPGARIREAAGLFCYAVGEPAALTGAALTLAGSGWRPERQGRKLYLLPPALDKAPAVAYVAGLAGADRVLAAGDSLLDAAMVAAADRGWVPARSPLAAQPLPPTVTITALPGHAAAAEIVAAMAGLVRAPEGSGALRH
jgi:hypothetical protein